MHKKTLAVALLLASGCLLTTKTDDLEPLVDAQGFCSAFATRIAGYFETCLGTHPSFGELVFAERAALCEAWGRSQDAGRIRYDRASAEACIDAFARSGCNLTNEDLEPCDRAVAGVVGPGGACGSGFDCDPRTTWGCAFTGATCPGACSVRAGLNQSCLTVGCQDGLVCDFNGSGNCVAAPAENQACVSFECGAGLFCNAASVCQRYGRSGTPCTDTPCDSNFFCDDLRTPATCQPYPESRLQTTTGARCGFPFECAAGLWCDFSLAAPVCKAQQSNVDCNATSAICKLPQICAGPSGTRTCRNPKLEGQACTGGIFECQDGLTCNAANGATGLCVLPAVIGDTCVTGGELRPCRTGWCDRFGTGKCNDHLPLGAACALDDWCSPFGSSAYCYDDGSGGKCVASCR